MNISDIKFNEEFKWYRDNVFIYFGLLISSYWVVTPKKVAINSTRNFPLFLGREDGKSWRAEMSYRLRELLAGMEREVLLLRGYTKGAKKKESQCQISYQSFWLPLAACRWQVCHLHIHTPPLPPCRWACICQSALLCGTRPLLVLWIHKMW